MDKTGLKKLIVVLLAAFLFFALLYAAGRPVLRLARDPDRIVEYYERRGVPVLLISFVIVVLQTMSACIPGGPFQLAAGYVFGTWRGALLVCTAAALGNTLAFAGGRRYGRWLMDFLFTDQTREKLSDLLSGKKSKRLHFLIMLLPSTPKDLYAWYAGYRYKDVHILRWGLVTWLARFPVIFLCAYSGDMIEERRYGLILAAFLVMVLCTLAGRAAFRKPSS